MTEDPLELAKEYLEHRDCSFDTCPFMEEHGPVAFSDAVKLAEALVELEERQPGNEYGPGYIGYMEYAAKFRIRELERALRQYADEANWGVDDRGLETYFMPMGEEEMPPDFEGSSIARAALAPTTEGEE